MVKGTIGPGPVGQLVAVYDSPRAEDKNASSGEIVVGTSSEEPHESLLRERQVEIIPLGR